jgi:hypothetical protein
VLGAQDGLLVPLGVVTGMAAAHPARALIIVAGLAEASQAEEQLYVSEIAAEGREIDEFPQRRRPSSARSQPTILLNPGNSGGALVDILGRVIGIPTLAAAGSQSGSAAAGTGFAIPSSVVKDIAGQLIRYGHVNTHRAYLGVQIGDTGRLRSTSGDVRAGS